ncbi:MAG: class I SAM-dependent methyltransferase [Humibacillus sp.]|nr:class I SAM-dependent methyltransferase [Humibacillus sp.]MDN5779435.1 class I SAM-dependent methyltransferase [Humibacillus sp.]
MTTSEAVSRSQVPEAFDEVADRYDLMVGLNPGYHAHLRASAQVLVDSLAADPTEPTAAPVTVLDIGCGSGASTQALVQTLDAAGLDYRLIGVDGSAGMLREARAKAWPANVSFAQGRAEELADLPELEDVELDAIFAAYLVRNVQQRDELFTSLLGRLRPGGILVVHEYSVAGNRSATAVWSAVCWGVVVPLGWITSRRTRLYRYLWRSVMDMDSVPALRTRMRDAGFAQVRSCTIGGWQRGIIHTFHGKRPARS